MDSSLQATPRKRTLALDPDTPMSRKRKHGGSTPAPNPAANAPFPTPPRSRRRLNFAAKYEPEYDLIEVVDEEGEDDMHTPKAGPSSRKPKPLPAHLETLFALHKAFNLALALHFATNPPVLPPHSSSATSVKVPNLTNLLAMRNTVERSSGRRFGEQEFARLAWVWTWDGKALPQDDKKDDNPFLVSSSAPAASDSVSGLSYLITTTRALCPKTGRRVATHGIGLELEFKAGDTRQLLMGGADGGLGSRGQGGSVRMIGKWSASGDVRAETVRQRLERWVELNGGMDDAGDAADDNDADEVDPDSSILPTPSTRDTTRSVIPPIPLLPLPKLQTSTLSASNLFGTSSQPLTPPRKVVGSGLADPFEMPAAPKAGGSSAAAPLTPRGTGTVEERRKALYERIKARSESKKANGTTLADAISGNSGILRRSVAEQQEELKRRSTLSRLETIAEAVMMMFSAPATAAPSSLPSASRTRRKAIPLAEVADMIVKSSKVSLSHAEADASLHMLADLCPFFLKVKTVGRADWLEMPATQALLPPSPGGSDRISAVAELLASPGSSGRVAISGPGSPGRVRRAAAGGLREVRERIRRELEQ